MILKRNESLGTALYGVVLNIDSMRERVAELSTELDESKRLVESLRRLSDMIGERFVDKFGDDELEAIYEKWEELEMANA